MNGGKSIAGDMARIMGQLAGARWWTIETYRNGSAADTFLQAVDACVLQRKENQSMIKELNSYISDPDSLDRRKIAELLALDDFSPVYREADRVRRETVGDTVHIRAIIEFSNICGRQCIYCGLNCRNSELERFRMSKDEIVRSAKAAVDAGYRTIVLQSGEDRSYPVECLGEIVEAVKSIGSDPSAVTLSCGEMSREDYAYLKSKGADRYLLKHETADPELYGKLHPCGTLEDRVKCLRDLKALGYETGSGFMIGLPGQTLETIADDLLLLKDIGCHMAGIGPFIANPKTPLAGARNGDPELTRRAVAIARLLLPHANLPVTTSLSVLSASGKNQKEHPPENSTGTAGIAVSPGSAKTAVFHGPDGAAGYAGESEPTGITGSCRQSSTVYCNDPGSSVSSAITKETYRNISRDSGGNGDPPDCITGSGTENSYASPDAELPGEAENPFSFGANVIMKKVTPDEYKRSYEIYPAQFKPTDIEGDRRELEETLRALGRVPL